MAREKIVLFSVIIISGLAFAGAVPKWCVSYESYDLQNRTVHFDATAPPLVVTIISPNAYEILYNQNTYYINWTSEGGVAPLSVKLEYRMTSEQNRHLIADNLPPNGSYPWRIPMTVVFTVEISATVTDATSNRSEDIVTVIVLPPFYVMISPPAATVEVGDEQLFEATAYDKNFNRIPNEAVLFGWFLSGDNIGDINPTIGNATVFTATAPGTGSLNCIAYHEGYISAALPAPITVPEPPLPTVSIISPNGGEKLAAGGSYTIIWKVKSQLEHTAPYTIDIYYSEDGGISYPHIVVDGLLQNVSGENSYNWSVPAISATTLKLKIVVTDRFSRMVSDTSDRNFEITVPIYMRIVAGDNQTATVDTDALPLVIKVTDYLDDPVEGVTINWFVYSHPAGATKQYVHHNFSTTNEKGKAYVKFHTGELAGTYLVSATTTKNMTGSQVIFTINALPAGLHHIVVSPNSSTVFNGSSQQFYAKGYDRYNNTLPELVFEWRVSGNIGFVNRMGLFTATKVGSGWVIATNGTVSGYANITVLPETTPPEVVGHFPNGINVPLNTVISVSFSEPMNKSSAENAFSISPAVEGEFEWQDNCTLVFKTRFLLKESTTYSIVIKTTAKDLAGNALKSVYSWQFKTADITPPKVISYSPTGNDVDVSVEIIVEFSEPMDCNATQSAFGLLCGTETIKGDFRWDVNNTKLIFKARPQLTPGEQYTVKISTDAKDLAGNAMLSEFNWSFTTKEERKIPPAGEKILLGGIILVLVLALLIFITVYTKKIMRKHSRYKKSDTEQTSKVSKKDRR